jgi:hypothetical protein
MPSINDRWKTSRKGFAMKINIGQIFLGTRLFIRLCLPATVFIGLCTGILMAFGAFLRTFSQTYPSNVGGSWLSLFIFYIIFGVALIRFNARLIHSSFGSEELRVQRHMAALSGLPFYVVCLLCLMMCILSILSDENPVIVYAMAFGFLVFIFASCGYFLLIRFFLVKNRESGSKRAQE